MKYLIAVVLVFIALVSGGCGIYSHKKEIITETKYPDGRVVVVTEICDTQIKSMREVKAGDIKVSTKCALTGGAESLTGNQQLFELMGLALKAAK